MSQDRSDEDLMLDVKNGDHDAYEQLVERHQNWAWSVAYRFLGDAGRAEELVQEVFVEIFEARDNYEPSAKFRTYLHRILVRRCIDRDRKREPIYTDELPTGDQRSRDPLNDLLDDKVGRAIQEALNELKPRQRMALILKYYLNQSYEEIAESMDCTMKAVESLLARARDTFKQEIPDRVSNHVLPANHDQSRLEAQ